MIGNHNVPTYYFQVILSIIILKNNLNPTEKEINNKPIMYIHGTC